MRWIALALALLALLVLLSSAFAQEEDTGLPPAEPPQPTANADTNAVSAPAAADSNVAASVPDANKVAPLEVPADILPGPLEKLFSFSNLAVAGLLIYLLLTAYLIKTDRKP